MARDIGDLNPKLRERLIQADPELTMQRLAIYERLELANKKAEAFMEKHGDIKTLREQVERNRAFIRGELTVEQFDEANKKSWSESDAAKRT